MQGRASNFSHVLADFKARLPGAAYVAIDTELTGVDIEGAPEQFDDEAEYRFERLCQVAERYTIMQLGLTLLGPIGDGEDSPRMACTSYNIFMYPWDGPDVQAAGLEPSFVCSASAMRFNGKHNLDFSAWINDGVPYMNRKDRDKISQHSSVEKSYDDNSDLTQLWDALCAANLPLVVHCPVDLFFLLAAFEQRPLPRDPREFAHLVSRCFRTVFDTAHLHGAIGGYRRLGLTKFFSDVQSRHARLRRQGNTKDISFELDATTAMRYGSDGDSVEPDLAHEAGYDSLVTAKLFSYLTHMEPTLVSSSGKRLFLYKSVDCLDLKLAAHEGNIGGSAYDVDNVILVVAELAQPDDIDTARLISGMGFGYQYQWIDPSHLLVIIRPPRGDVSNAAFQRLTSRVTHQVVRWTPVSDWLGARRSRCLQSETKVSVGDPRSSASTQTDASVGDPRSSASTQTEVSAVGPRILASTQTEVSALGPRSLVSTWLSVVALVKDFIARGLRRQIAQLMPAPPRAYTANDSVMRVVSRRARLAILAVIAGALLRLRARRARS